VPRYISLLFAVAATASLSALWGADISLGAGLAVEPGQVVTLPLVLARPAPAGGAYINLTASDPSVFTVRPSTILIPSGATVPSSLPTVSGIDFGAAAVSATAPGFMGDSQIVRVAANLLGPAALTLQRGAGEDVLLSLTSPAPSAATLTLTSDDPAVATVPALITIPPGGSVAVVRVTGVAAGSTRVRAGGSAFSADKVISVHVTAPGAINLPENVTVDEGQSAPFPISLSTPAPMPGLQVEFQSSDPARVTMTPASVFISEGAVTPAVQPRVNGLNIGGAVMTAAASGYQPASQSVTVPATMSFSPSSLSLTSGTPGKLLLALSASAPWGIGLTVQLTSSNPAVATVQPVITFYPDGSAFTTLVIPVTPVGPGSTLITAGAPPYIPAVVAGITVGGSSQPASITVAAGSLQSAVVNTAFASPLAVVVKDRGGVPVSGIPVTFAAPSAGPGGSFSGPASQVTNVSGVAVSPNFTANGIPGNYAVTASVSGIAAPAVFSLTNTASGGGAISLASNVSLSPAASVLFPVTLTVPAPPSGVTVLLSTSDPSKVTVSPASVFIAGGATSPAVTPQVSGVTFGAAVVSATASGYSSASQSVQVTGALTLSPASQTVRTTGPVALTLRLSAAAPPGGLIAALSSSNPGVLRVAASVAFAPGTTTLTLDATATAMGTSTITATSAIGNVAGALATVSVQPSADIVLGSGLTVEPGQSIPITVGLAAPAPAPGVFIGLTSSDPSVLDISPSVLFLPEGNTEPLRYPQVNALRYGSASVSATAPGLTGDSQTVAVAGTLYGPASITVDRGTTQNTSFTISAPSPAPLTISLSSDNPGIASVPTSITIPANGTVAFIPIAGAGSGTTSIHLASPVLSRSVNVNVTVVSPGAVSLPSGVTVTQGDSAPYPVTLGSPAPLYGVSVALTSSDPDIVAISPPSVFIQEGADSPVSQPRVSGLNIGTATITASVPGYLQGSQNVTVPATITFLPASLAVTAPVQGKLLLVLSASAPWGTGLTVNLTSSDPSVATVPPTVNFYPDGSAFTSVTVLVTPHAKGTTLIRAGVPPLIPESVAAVIVQ
jgi:hypothetical protein